MRIAYHGEPGAFGEAAALACDPAAEPVPFATAQAALAAVRDGRCERAVLPVRNSWAGPVELILALLPAPGLEPSGEVRVPIRMALLGVPGATLQGLGRVSSHPVALAQCSALIAELGLATIAAANTAIAARDAALAGDRATAVLASARAGAVHGLVTLRDDVGDDPRAVTTFIVLGRATSLLSGAA